MTTSINKKEGDDNEISLDNENNNNINKIWQEKPGMVPKGLTAKDGM
jgi:hypothetical protein